MFSNILLVGMGGALGSILRYLCQKSFNQADFPYGTLLVNIIGCLLIGIFWGLFSKPFDDTKRLLLMTGLCGGFTTFSAFTHESLQMMMEDRWLTFAAYSAVSVFAGLFATFLGYKLTN